MKKFFNSKVFAIFFIAILFFASCQKEELVVESTNETTNNVFVSSGFFSEPAIINGDSIVFNFQKNVTKGFTNDLILEQKIIKDYPYSTTSNTYRVIKVVRPNGRYFWIMIDNFKYASSGSWIYGFNNSNLDISGRLYNWNAAYSNRTKIMMMLPKITAPSKIASDPISKDPPLYPVFGRLPNFQDIKDLLESSSIANSAMNGTNVFEHDYFDAFVFGLANANWDATKANHTLGGWRDNLIGTPGTNAEFSDINVRGRFWTNEIDTPGSHYPLEISNLEYFWSAYVNAGHADGYGFSVRYVFEPIYQ